MSVKPAKDVFGHKTINEMLTNISKRLRCCDELFARLHDPNKKHSKESNHFVETLKILKSIMNDSDFVPEIAAADNIDNVLANPTVNDVMELRSDVAYLEFSIWTSKLFIDNLMNKEMKLTIATIDEVQNDLREGLNYFSSWYSYCEAQRSMSDKKEDNKMFLSKITYNNMRVGIVGFLAYARLVLQLECVHYVPMLHSSSSTIEAAFSQIRMHRGDDPANISRVLASLYGWEKNNANFKCKQQNV
jgi:hypothetical protein